MKLSRQTIVVATIRLLIALIFAGSSVGYESGSFRRSNLPEPASENVQPNQDDCDLEKLKKQMESLKEKEDNFNKAVRDLLKERDKLKQWMEKRIKEFRDQLSPEDKAEFDKALKDYNKTVDAYDAALSNANAAIADGTDPAKANKDAGVQEKKDDMSKALDEMFKPIEAEEKKENAPDKEAGKAVGEAVEKANEAAKGETDDEEAPKPPKEPKPLTKAQKMKGLKINLEGLNDAFDKVQGQLRVLGVRLKEVEKERKELQKKLKEAEEKCLEPVASGAPTFTAPGYEVKIVLENGLLRVHETTPFGGITFNMPGDVQPGETFGGTIWLDPAGKNDGDKARNLSKLEDFEFQLASGLTLHIPKYAKTDFWDEPNLRPWSGQFNRTILQLLDGDKPLSRIGLPKLPAPVLGSGYIIPTGGQHGSFITIPGPFDGVVPPTDSVTIGGTRIPIVAESPHSRVVWDTSRAVGPTNIKVGENGQAGTCPFNNVSVKLSAPNLHLLRGQTTVLTVVVSGLDGLKQDVPFELVNHSPAIVSMDGGNKQSAIIHAADLQPNGTYTTTRTLTGVAPGSFNITATVDWKETCKPPMEVMRLQKSATVTNGGSQ
jgi:hypothetical protein